MIRKTIINLIISALSIFEKGKERESAAFKLFKSYLKNRQPTGILHKMVYAFLMTLILIEHAIVPVLLLVGVYILLKLATPFGDK